MQKRLRRGGKNTQNYTKRKKNDLHQPDNHDGVVTHLDHDILECEVKCALGSITTNKTSGDNRIPAELFKTLKDDAVKVVYSICKQIQKTQQRSQVRKRSVFVPFPKKQSQRMFKLPYNCAHITCRQGYAQNASSSVSAEHELRTSRSTSWVSQS